MNTDAPIGATVVVASYSRPALVGRLLEDLAAQHLDPRAFEVVIVDDGSPEPVSGSVESTRSPFALTILRQANAGPAAARHRGATIARGEVLVFVDDDMRLPETFLEAHLAVHASTPRAVVVGRIRPAPALERMPIFERFHAKLLAEHEADLRRTGRPPRGAEVCTGNLSMRLRDYHAVGGFDATLGRSEDAELGVRLEKSGARLCYSDDAYTVHASDHTELAKWLERAYLYGVFEQRIARKHPDVPRVDPWHWLDVVGRARKPLLFFPVLAPAAAKRAVDAIMHAALALDARGLEKQALVGATLAYGLQYFRGVRAEEGSALAALRSYVAFRANHAADGG